MRLIQKFLLLICLSLAVLITSCSTDGKPEFQSSRKVYYLPRNMYVVQTQDQRWSREFFYLVPVPKKTVEWKKSYSNLFHHKIPDLEDYEDLKTLWQSWQGIDLFTQSRIIGVVPSGTPYLISKTTSAPFRPYDIEIKLVQSPFQENKIMAEYRVLKPRKRS